MSLTCHEVTIARKSLLLLLLHQPARCGNGSPERANCVPLLWQPTASCLPACPACAAPAIAWGCVPPQLQKLNASRPSHAYIYAGASILTAGALGLVVYGTAAWTM